MSLRTMVFLAACLLVTLAALAWLFRYEVAVGGAGGGFVRIVRLDRWTGRLFVGGASSSLVPMTVDDSGAGHD